MRALALILAVATSAGCAARQPSTAPAAPDSARTPDLTGVLRLVGNSPKTNSMITAHACPVEPTVAITNRHVAAAAFFTWQAGEAEGVLVDTGADRFRDVATVAPRDGTFTRWYPIASAAPAVDDPIWMLNWDRRNRKVAYAPRVLASRVTNIFNGNIAYFPAAKPGSSGGCVLNERGEVVGIVKGGGDMEDATVVGIAIGVWGGRRALVSE